MSERLREFKAGKNTKLLFLYYVEVFKLLANEARLDTKQYQHLFSAIEDFTLDKIKLTELINRKMRTGVTPFCLYEQAKTEHWDITFFFCALFQYNGFFNTIYDENFAIDVLNSHIHLYNNLEKKYQICGDRLFFLLAENNCPIHLDN